MSRIAIFYNRLYDFENNKLLIGGIETYIMDLSRLCLDLGFEVNIYIMLISKKDQYHSINYERINIIEIYGSGYQKIFNYISKQYTADDILIIATDMLNIKSDASNVIAIQHGISFDYPYSEIKTRLPRIKQFLLISKIRRCINFIHLFDNVKNKVCVDYNYFNWYRTIANIEDDQNVVVIPNYCSDIITEEELGYKLHKQKKRKILFARRFVKCRGTLLFIEVVKKLMIEFPDLEVTFAGDGDLKELIVNNFKNCDGVFLKTYKSCESVSFHKTFDIAVIPTIWSEGTSLALCEAMSAGCFPVATHVGGITNIIIDGFNGKLSYPDEKSFYETLREVLIMDDKTFNAIVLNAYNSARTSFSIDSWEKKWTKFIKKISKK